MASSMIQFLIFFAFISISITYGHFENKKHAEEWFDKAVRTKEKVTKLRFYFHQRTYGYGTNATAAPVTDANITLTSPTLFGMIVVMDNPLTTGPELYSKPLGHIQGTYGLSSMEELSFSIAANFVFTDGEYNGSSIAVFGLDPPFHQYRELSIIGGSGVFRMARGFVTFHSVFYDFVNRNATVEVNVMALHY